MAGKKKEEVAEEPKKVSVEMTETERDTFVEMMAKKEVAAEAPKPEPKMQVQLKFGHRINGIPYGPGRVIVGQSLADLLVFQDQEALKARIQETQSGRHLVEILGNGQTRAIPVPQSGEMF